MPSGTIVMWSGAESEIPSGWTLCDGSDGAPDLRDRFAVGAGSGGAYAPGDTGGSDSVQLSRAEMPTHSHGIPSTDTTDGSGGGYVATDNKSGNGSPSTTNEGSGNSHENRPPYYALCHIMKT